MLSLQWCRILFGKAFNAGSEFARNGSQFDSSGLRKVIVLILATLKAMCCIRQGILQPV